MRGRLYTSESDVYRRQILTYKDGPRTARVNAGDTSDVLDGNVHIPILGMIYIKQFSALYYSQQWHFKKI